LSWDSSEGAQVYKIYRGPTFDKHMASPVSGWISATEYIDVGIDPEINDYIYFIQAAVDNTGKFSTALSPGVAMITLISGIEDLEGTLSISPNPVDGQFKLKYSSPSSGSVSVRLHDISGKLVAQYDGFKNSSEFSNIYSSDNLPKGLYILSVIQSGTLMSRRKLIKH
jgi:hypothetical protein